MPKIHKSITEERVADAVEGSVFGLDNPGFCLDCGIDVDGCDPDAEKDRCDSCGAHSVYGAEQVALMMF
jgi:hypothetical protein